MSYQDTKVYYDGSHYIAIPKRPAPRHPGVRLPEDPVEVIEDVRNEPTEDAETTIETTQEPPLESTQKARCEAQGHTAGVVQRTVPKASV